MKITNIEYNGITGNYNVELDYTLIVSIGNVSSLLVDDEVQLSLIKSGPAGGDECPVCSGTMGSTLAKPEDSPVRAPDGKSDRHF